MSSLIAHISPYAYLMRSIELVKMTINDCACHDDSVVSNECQRNFGWIFNGSAHICSKRDEWQFMDRVTAKAIKTKRTNYCADRTESLMINRKCQITQPICGCHKIHCIRCTKEVKRKTTMPRMDCCIFHTFIAFDVSLKTFHNKISIQYLIELLGLVMHRMAKVNANNGRIFSAANDRQSAFSYIIIESHQNGARTHTQRQHYPN